MGVKTWVGVWVIPEKWILDSEVVEEVTRFKRLTNWARKLLIGLFYNAPFFSMSTISLTYPIWLLTIKDLSTLTSLNKHREGTTMRTRAPVNFRCF